MAIIFVWSLADDDNGEELVVASADVMGGDVASLVLLVDVSVLYLLCGVANDWTLPVSRIVAKVRHIDRFRCFIMVFDIGSDMTLLFGNCHDGIINVR